MNNDILKGILREIKGGVKERWGKLTDNDFRENEGKGELLLGRLQKKYGYIRDKAELDYEDGVELAAIVSRIRQTMTSKKDITAIAFIARYGKPLLANNRENPIAEKEKRNGYDTDRYSDTHPHRGTAHLASQ